MGKTMGLECDICDMVMGESEWFLEPHYDVDNDIVTCPNCENTFTRSEVENFNEGGGNLALT